MVKKSLGDILVSTGAINTQQFSECQKAVEQIGQTIEQCLLEKKFATVQDIAKAYAEYASLDYVEHVTEKMADLTLLGKVPLHFLRDNVVMPVMIDGRVTILTANPMDFQPLDELNLLLGGEVQYAVAPRPVIIDSINRYYPLEGAKQMIEELEEERELLKILILP